MKRIVAFFLMLMMVMACVSVPAMAEGQDLVVCVGPDPETLDPALNASVDGSIILTNAFSGLYGYNRNEAGEIVVFPDCAQEIVTPTPLGDGRYQYVVKLKEGLKWSDGVDMKASDFTYAWNRAVEPSTASDYQYIFDVIDGYDAEKPALNISADDAAGTVTIVTKSFCIYFDQLLAFPTYYPVRKDLVDTYGEAWPTDPKSYISNGAFKMSSWTIGDKIVFVKNDLYWDAASVKLDSITYALSDDDDAIFANYSNGTYMLATNVPISQIPILKNDPARMDVDFFIGDYIGVYFLEFNVEKSFAPGIGAVSDSDEAWANWTPAQNAEVRRALSLLIDRNYIVTQITQAGQKPAYGFVPISMDDGTGTEFRSKATPWWSVAEEDYDANCEEAIEILKKYYTYDEATEMFTDFPTFEYSVNPTSGNLAMCAAIKDMWDDYGIEASVDQRVWSVIQTALTDGDFTMSRLGWIADYNDPINYLEIYVGASGNNHPRLGKNGKIGSGAFYGENGDQTWADAYESLVTQIKTEPDLAARAEVMYKAETILQKAMPVLPIYYYTNVFLCNTSLVDYIYSPLGWINFKYASIAK